MVQKSDGESDVSGAEVQRAPRIDIPLDLRPIILVERRGESVLVEYKEKGHRIRVLLPVEAYQEGEMSLADLQKGHRLSVPWAKLFKSSVTPAKMEAALYGANIWTVEDLQERWRKAQQVMIRLSMADLAAMVKRSRNREE